MALILDTVRDSYKIMRKNEIILLKKLSFIPAGEFVTFRPDRFLNNNLVEICQSDLVLFIIHQSILERLCCCIKYL